MRLIQFNTSEADQQSTLITRGWRRWLTEQVVVEILAAQAAAAGVGVTGQADPMEVNGADRKTLPGASEQDDTE